MALKIKAKEKKLKFSKNENDPGFWRYVMVPDLYSTLGQDKVIKEAAIRSATILAMASITTPIATMIREVLLAEAMVAL